MVFFLDLDLVISRKIVHEGKGFMSSTRIDDLVNERCGEVVFGTCPIEVMEVCTIANGTEFFIHGNRIRNPNGVHNGVNEVGYAQLLYLGFDSGHLEGWMGHCFWHMGSILGHVSMWCSMMDGSRPGISV